MDVGESLRRQANRLLELALREFDSGDHSFGDKFVETAMRLLDQADRLDRSPVAQQQQQIQPKTDGENKP